MALPDFLPGRFALARGRPGDYFALERGDVGIGNAVPEAEPEGVRVSDV